MEQKELVTPSMPPARKNEVEWFVSPESYQGWMKRHPYVEVISVVALGNSSIVLTYKEAF